MTVTFHALWMLCALGVVVFATSAARDARQLVALAVGFAAATVLTGASRLPDPAWAGVLAAGAALLPLFRPRYTVLSALWGGALGGMLTSMLEVQGLPSAVATAAVALGVAGTVWLARARAAFAPDALRDEALLAVCLLALVVAVLPGVIDGWQAAGNLTIQPASPDPATAIPTWTITLVATATALGAVYALWSRR